MQDFNLSVLSNPSTFRSIRGHWNASAHEANGSMLGVDGTSTFEWFEAIHAAFEHAADMRILVLSSGSECVGLLPCFCPPKEWLWPRLKAPLEVYGGRGGLLLKEFSPELVKAMIAGLSVAFPRWRSFEITLVDRSPSFGAIEGFAHSCGFNLAIGGPQESPYMPLCETAEEFQRAIGKDVRQRVKSSTNKCKAIGGVRLQLFDNELQAEELLALVLDVERKSWKHAAGSAITNNVLQERFYRALFPQAMRSGTLLGVVLFLADAPIAHGFGLLRDGVFCLLKHSHVQAFDDLTPSHLLHSGLFDELRRRGVHTFDFMGGPEKHKLRWSSASACYVRRTLRIFNRSIIGRLSFHGQRIKSRIAMALSNMK